MPGSGGDQGELLRGVTEPEHGPTLPAATGRARPKKKRSRWEEVHRDRPGQRSGGPRAARSCWEVSARTGTGGAERFERDSLSSAPGDECDLRAEHDRPRSGTAPVEPRPGSPVRYETRLTSFPLLVDLCPEGEAIIDPTIRAAHASMRTSAYVIRRTSHLGCGPKSACVRPDLDLRRSTDTK